MEQLKAIPRGAREKIREGYIAAVAYNKERNVSFAIEERSFDRIFRNVSTHGLIEIDIEGQGTIPTIVRSVQMDKRRRKAIHADFFLVTYGQEIEAPVPVHTTGRAKGVAQNSGILDVVMHNLPIVAPGPRRIPQELIVDVTHLDIGDSIKAGDIPLPEGCRLAVDADLPVISILPPQKIVTDVEAAPTDADEVPAINVQAADTEDGQSST